MCVYQEQWGNQTINYKISDLLQIHAYVLWAKIQIWWIKQYFVHQWCNMPLKTYNFKLQASSNKPTVLFHFSHPIKQCKNTQKACYISIGKSFYKNSNITLHLKHCQIFFNLTLTHMDCSCASNWKTKGWKPTCLITFMKQVRKLEDA